MLSPRAQPDQRFIHANARRYWLLDDSDISAVHQDHANSTSIFIHLLPTWMDVHRTQYYVFDLSYILRKVVLE